MTVSKSPNQTKPSTTTAISPKRPPTNKPIWKQFSNFANAHPMGIEKTLRLIQALCQIVSSSPIVVHALSDSSFPALTLQCGAAKNHIALARRYLRFFKFIECFDAGYAAAYQSVPPAPSERQPLLLRMLDVGKWTCLGVYFLMEDLTILDAMGLWVTPWATTVFFEANKFWFYAICMSLMSSFLTLFFAPGEKAAKVKRQQRDVSPMVKRIVVDGCDALIPGSFVGWIGANPTQVGAAMVVSTLVASQDIWIKANM